MVIVRKSPKFELSRSWGKVFFFVLTVILNIGVEFARYGRKGGEVHEKDKNFWANVKTGLMIMSYLLSVANSLWESRDKLFNWYKIVSLSILLLVHIRFYYSATMTTADHAPTSWKEVYADWCTFWLVLSCALSGLSALVRLKGKERELELEDDDPELAFLPNRSSHPTTTKEFQQAIADKDKCKESLVNFLIEQKRRNEELDRDYEIIKRWVNRAGFE